MENSFREEHDARDVTINSNAMILFILQSNKKHRTKIRKKRELCSNLKRICNFDKTIIL